VTTARARRVNGRWPGLGLATALVRFLGQGPGPLGFGSPAVGLLLSRPPPRRLGLLLCGLLAFGVGLALIQLPPLNSGLIPREPLLLGFSLGLLGLEHRRSGLFRLELLGPLEVEPLPLGFGPVALDPRRFGAGVLVYRSLRPSSGCRRSHPLTLVTHPAHPRRSFRDAQPQP